MAPAVSQNSLHGWRSRAIDAFALAEANIETLLRKFGLASGSDHLSSKIEKLRKVKPSSTLSESRKAKLDKLLCDLHGLLPLRNDLVHAPMQVREDGEHAVACFANPNLRCEFSNVTREISAPRLQALAGRVTSLAKALEAE